MVLRGVTFVTLQFQIKQYGFHLSFMGCFLPQAVPLCAQRPNPHGIENLPCGFCLLGCNPSPYEHHVP